MSDLLFDFLSDGKILSVLRFVVFEKNAIFGENSKKLYFRLFPHFFYQNLLVQFTQNSM